MPSKIARRPKILLTYVFAEFGEHAKVIEEKFRARSLSERYKLENLNNGMPHPDRPVDVSLRSVEEATLVILLLGATLGGTPPESERTYIQVEASAAARSRKLLTIIVGDAESYKASIWNAQMIDFVENELEKTVTVGDTQGANHDSLEDIANTVIDRIDRFVGLQEAELEDRVAELESPLAVSGYTRSSIPRVNRHLRQQLRIIYNDTDEWQDGDDQSGSHRPDQWREKSWSLKNVRFKNTVGALRNLDRVVDNYGSDLMASFWMTRIWSQEREPTTAPSKAYSRVEIGAEVATDPPDIPGHPPGTYSLIASLIYTHGARIAWRASDRERMNRFIELADLQRPTFELTELRLELDLEFLRSLPRSSADMESRTEFHRAARRVRAIFDLHLGFYVQMVNRLENEYGYVLRAVVEKVRRALVGEVQPLFDLQSVLEHRLAETNLVTVKQPPIMLDHGPGESLVTLVALCRRLVIRVHVALRGMAWGLREELDRTIALAEMAPRVEEIESRFRGLAEVQLEAMRSTQKSKDSAFLNVLAIGAASILVFVLSLQNEWGAGVTALSLLAGAGSIWFYLSRAEEAKRHRELLFKDLNAAFSDVEASTTAPPFADPQQMDRCINEVLTEATNARQNLDTELTAARQRLAARTRSFIEAVEAFERLVIPLHGGRYLRSLQSRGLEVHETDGASVPLPLVPDEVWAHVERPALATRSVLVERHDGDPSRWRAYYDDSLNLELFRPSTG